MRTSAYQWAQVPVDEAIVRRTRIAMLRAAGREDEARSIEADVEFEAMGQVGFECACSLCDDGVLEELTT